MEMEKKEKCNVALVSSKGGHLGQIKLIFSLNVLGKNKTILITEDDNVHKRERYFLKKYRAYFFKKDNLRFNVLKYLKSILDLREIYKRERINLIITNGAQLSIPAVVAAKILGIKVIFIDTVIRVKTPNWSARACYFFSDVFLVQHPSMARKYGKKAKYIGGII